MLKYLSFIALLTPPVAMADAPVATIMHQGTGGAPLLGAFGFDESGMDKTLRPGDDFFRYANGAWVTRTEIPPEKSGYDRSTVLRDLSDRRVADIIATVAKGRNAPGSAGEKIAVMYGSFMDEQAIAALGVTPLLAYFKVIDEIRTPSDLAAAFARANRTGIMVPFKFFVQQDLRDNTRHAAYVRQSGLGLRDREYYLSADPESANARRAYRRYASVLLRLVGRADPEAAADRVIALEQTLAQAQWSAADDRDVNKLYNPMEVTLLASSMPGVDWGTMLTESGLSGLLTLIVFEPSALKAEAAIVAATPLATWKEYLAFQTIAAAAPYLAPDFVNADFAFNGVALSGQSSMTARATRGVGAVNEALGQAVGQLYVAKYFPPEAKAQIDVLVSNLLRAMDQRLSDNRWMSTDTKQMARRKLAALTAKIGYPETWQSYESLQIVAGDVVGNAFRARAFEYDRQLATLGKTVDRSAWAMTPQTASAYSSAPMNDVVFPAAILQPPYFDPNADPAVNYGAIGVVIGHEISHNFDARGSQFDPSGRLRTWWTPQDRARFDALSATLVAQYDQYEPLPGVHVNGALTLNENMADLAGINIAYDAYHLSLGGKTASVIGGYSGDQRFFLGYAQGYRAKQRVEALRNQLMTDPHTPEPARVNVVRNLDAWYDAFDVRPGQAGYLAPEARVKIW